MFLKKLENYKAINQIIADKAISKILNHLYYLNEECVGFCLLDESVVNDSAERGIKLIQKYQCKIKDEEQKQHLMKVTILFYFL